MPYCTNCGNANPDEARFCSKCGSPLVPEGLGDSTATISIAGAERSDISSDRQLNPVDAAAVDALPRGSALLVVQRGPGAGSLNGTYVNRDRIDTVVLKDTDEVQIGKYRLVFFQGHENQ
jgi:RNA polymerase subunit RPABC4/transcription elongation factor Spt4